MKSWGISARILLLTIVPTVTISMLLGGYFISMRISDVQQNLETRGEAYITDLVARAEYGLYARNIPYLQQITASVLASPDVDLAAVYSNNGNMMAATGKEDLNFDTSLFDRLDYLQHQDVFTYEQGNEEFFVAPVLLRSVVLVPSVLQTGNWSNYLSKRGSRLGWVVVRLSRHQIVAAKYQSIIATMIIVLLGLAISVLFGLRIGRNVISPLFSIINVVKKLRRGDLEARVTVEAPGEMRALREGINKMAASLMNSRREMEESIEKATAELRQTLATIERQNAELEQARREALEASRIKSAFLANMSHEIRTPMNGIIGFTDLLQKTSLSDQQQEFVQTIRNSSQNLLEIINNILDISKIEADKLELEQTRLDLYQVVEEVVMLVKPLALEKEVELGFYIAEDVPHYVLGDQVRLSQVFTNFLGNAIKFTREGRVWLYMVMQHHDDGRSLIQVEVRDTGIGMNEQQMSRLFQSFSQADSSTTRRYGGTGLGLTIAKSIVEKMGGEVGVESEPGEGTLFWFTMPLPPADTAEQTREQLPARAAEQQQQALVYDCSRHGQDALVSNLKTLGIQAQCVHREETLIDYLAESGDCYGWLILGFQQVQESRANRYKAGLIRDIRNFSRARLVLLANDFDYKLKQFAEQLGADQYLSRPCRRNALQRCLFGETLTLSEPGSTLSASDTELSRDAPADASCDHAQATPVAAPGITVLAVDDNTINLKLLTTMLKNCGVTVVEAESGQQALDLAQRYKFDLVFMDLQMPEMDGYETACQLRESTLNCHTPIIALSADVLGQAHEQQAEQAGFVAFYTKPVDETNLKEALRSCIPAGDDTVPDSHATRPGGENDQQNAPTAEQGAEGSRDSSDDTRHMPSLIDYELGRSLANGDASLAREMLDMFVNGLAETLETLNAYYTDENREALQAEVHKLHGGCCYCGVPALKEASARLEQLLKHDGSRQACDQAFATLVSVIRQTMQQYRNDNP